MSFDESLLAGEAQAYLERTLAPPHAEMARIEQRIAKEGQPAVGRSTGAILRTLAAGLGATRALEVGTNVGYSGLWLASGLAPGGTLDTIEIDPSLAKRARESFAACGYGERARVHEGAALAVLPRLKPSYDLVFLDAVKAEYPAYLDHAVRLLRPGGIVCADNAFWHGRVWAEGKGDADCEGMREYTRRVMDDARFVTALAPSEDGLLVSVLRR